MKKYAIFIIASLIFVMCGSALPVRPRTVWFGQYMALMLVFFFGSALILWNFNKFLSILLGYCTYSVFYVANMNARGMYLLVQFTLACLAMYGVSKLSKQYRQWIKWGILAMVILQFSWVILQYFNLDPLFHKLGAASYVDDIVGWSGAKDQLGSFFALSLPAMLSIHPILIIPNLIGLVASKSSFAIVAGIISGLVLLFFKYKKFFHVVLIICLIGGTIAVKMIDNVGIKDFKTRFSVWRYAIERVWEGKTYIEKNNLKAYIITNPIIGYGLGNFQRIFPNIPQVVTRPKDNSGIWHEFNYINEKFTHAHNDYIEAYYELGHIGIIIILSLLINFIINFIKSIKTIELVTYFAGVLAYLLNASGNFVSQIATSGALLCVFYGLYEGTRRELNGTKTG